jgi:hypothetical protein
MQAPKRTAIVRDALRAKTGLAFDTPVQIVIDKDAVAQGRKPLPAARQDTAKLQARVEELYGLAGAPLESIDAAFKFSSLESDAEFHYLHVEPLLDHAAVLLERCVSRRARWDQLQVEKWRLRLELAEFFRLVQVEERAREGGEDTLNYERAVLDSAAEQSLQENHKEAETQLKALLSDLSVSGLNRRVAAREVTAWLSAYPLKDSDLRGDDAGYTFDGVRKSKPEHLFEAARKEADQDAWEQVYSLLVQIYEAVAESEAARLRKESLELHTKACLAAISIKRDRAQIARDAVWEKAFQIQAANSILNYHERLALVHSGFSQDFREAIACLTAAERGLKELYDFPAGFPKQPESTYLDDVNAWCFKARNRLAQMAQLDQSYTLAVSLKQLLKGEWEAGRNASEWTFDLTDDMFAGQSYVRLRGLSVSVVGAEPEIPKGGAQKSNAPPPEKVQGFWWARVTLPAQGLVRNPAGVVRELDQKSLPVCYLGRVGVGDSPGAPEIGGSRVLHNASPIGKQWKLRLSPQSTGGTPTEALEDVQLHLHLAVRG